MRSVDPTVRPSSGRPALVGVRREPRQDRGRQRDGDDGVRHHHDQQAVGVDEVAGAVAAADRAARRELDHDEVRRLGDDHEQHRPDAQGQRLRQLGVAEVEAGSVGEPRGAQVGHEDEELDHDPQRRAEAEQDLLAGAERLGPGRAVPGRSEEDEVGDQHQDRQQVVGDRRPHHRTEAPAGVEDLPDEDVHAVEEDLRQAPAGQGDDRLQLGDPVRVEVATVEVEAQQQRCGDDQDDRDDAQEERREGDHPAGVGVAAVGVLLDPPDQLRHQHRVEDAPGQEDVDHVGQRVGDREEVAPQARPEGDHQQRGAHVARRAGQDGARRHDRRRGQDLLVALVAHERSAAGVPAAGPSAGAGSRSVAGSGWRSGRAPVRAPARCRRRRARRDGP